MPKICTKVTVKLMDGETEIRTDKTGSDFHNRQTATETKCFLSNHKSLQKVVWLTLATSVTCFQSGPCSSNPIYGQSSARELYRFFHYIIISVFFNETGAEMPNMYKLAFDKLQKYE